MIPSYRKSLDRIGELIKMAPTVIDSDAIGSAIACHICVLQSGCIENLIRDTLSKYFLKKSSPDVARFCSKAVANLQNPTPEKIIELIRKLDDNVALAIEEFWKDNGIKDHIASIVANRNNIAHGGNQTVTLSRVKEFNSSLNVLVVYFEQKFCN